MIEIEVRSPHPARSVRARRAFRAGAPAAFAGPAIRYRIADARVFHARLTKELSRARRHGIPLAV